MRNRLQAIIEPRGGNTYYEIYTMCKIDTLAEKRANPFNNLMMQVMSGYVKTARVTLKCRNFAKTIAAARFFIYFFHFLFN